MLSKMLVLLQKKGMNSSYCRLNISGNVSSEKSVSIKLNSIRSYGNVFHVLVNLSSSQGVSACSMLFPWSFEEVKFEGSDKKIRV